MDETRELLIEIDRKVTRLDFTILGTNGSIGLAERVEGIETVIKENAPSWSAWKKVENIGMWVVRVMVVTAIMSAIGILIKVSGMV